MHTKIVSLIYCSSLNEIQEHTVNSKAEISVNNCNQYRIWHCPTRSNMVSPWPNFRSHACENKKLKRHVR